MWAALIDQCIPVIGDALPIRGSRGVCSSGWHPGAAFWSSENDCAMCGRRYRGKNKEEQQQGEVFCTKQQIGTGGGVRGQQGGVFAASSRKDGRRFKQQHMGGSRQPLLVTCANFHLLSYVLWGYGGLATSGPFWWAFVWCSPCSTALYYLYRDGKNVVCYGVQQLYVYCG